MQYRVSIKDDVSPDLARKLAALKNRRRAMLAIGQEIVTSAKRAFSISSLRPAPWAPLRPSTLARKGQKTSPLILSGTMARSPRVIEATEDRVTVGSDRRVGNYSLAAIHQYGAPRRRIPPRPFFPFGGGPDRPVLTPQMARIVDGRLRALIEKA
jgi:phage gpG-like protein